MKSILYTLFLAALTFFLTSFFYAIDFEIEVERIFLSISTFIFSIFTGFFISRQASRFNRVRETVTSFDGVLSSIYRTSGHISSELQVAIGAVIQAHYERIISTQQWNIHFLEKSSTLSNLHALVDTHVEEDKVTKVSNQALGVILKGLASCQDIRKRMVALYEERIPREQWVLILFFVCMLILTVAFIPSAGQLFVSLLKAAFIISVLSVIYILFKLNSLAFTENLMGERSAQDVLGIINGSK